MQVWELRTYPPNPGSRSVTRREHWRGWKILQVNRLEDPLPEQAGSNQFTVTVIVPMF